MSIHIAVKEGDISELKRLLSNDRDFMGLEDNRGYLPLHVAVQYSQEQAAKLLLQKGADEYAQTANAFKTALHIAAATDNMFFIRLLDKHAIKLAVKARDAYGYTPLHFAVRAENEGAVITLVQRGANMEAKSHKGETALHCAVRKGDYGIVSFLLRNKADAYARDREGNSVLHKAEDFGTYSLLNSYFVDFWQEDNFQENSIGQTPLHLAAKRGDSRMVRDMCTRGADPAQEDDAGHTPLYFAREGSHEQTVQWLEHYADLQGSHPAGYYFNRESF